MQHTDPRPGPAVQRQPHPPDEALKSSGGWGCAVRWRQGLHQGAGLCSCLKEKQFLKAVGELPLPSV